MKTRYFRTLGVACRLEAFKSGAYVVSASGPNCKRAVEFFVDRSKAYRPMTINPRVHHQNNEAWCYLERK